LNTNISDLNSKIQEDNDNLHNNLRAFKKGVQTYYKFMKYLSSSEPEQISAPIKSISPPPIILKDTSEKTDTLTHITRPVGGGLGTISIQRPVNISA